MPRNDYDDGVSMVKLFVSCEYSKGISEMCVVVNEWKSGI